MAALQGEPTAVARQRVRRALRRARQDTTLSQGDVAKKLGWSLSKVQRIEAAEVAVSLTDLRALLEVYGIVDPEVVARLSNDAQVSRRQRWVTPADYREHLTPALRSLLQFESEAVAIRAYQPVLIPGVLQTPAVAEIILSWSTNRITDDQRRVRLDVRMLRRKQTVEDDAGPEYLLILDESVIKRHIGGAKVMAEQLETLAEFAQRPNVRVRVVPLEKGALVGLVEPFQVLSLSDEEDDTVVYREFYNGDQILHDTVDSSEFREIFDQLWAAALGEDATVGRIAAEAAVLRSSTDAESGG
jgi:transcriptional regulator with XRE-family HTH domain